MDYVAHNDLVADALSVAKHPLRFSVHRSRSVLHVRRPTNATASRRQD